MLSFPCLSIELDPGDPDYRPITNRSMHCVRVPEIEMTIGRGVFISAPKSTTFVFVVVIVPPVRPMDNTSAVVGNHYAAISARVVPFYAQRQSTAKHETRSRDICDLDRIYRYRSCRL